MRALGQLKMMADIIVALPDGYRHISPRVKAKKELTRTNLASLRKRTYIPTENILTAILEVPPFPSSTPKYTLIPNP